MPKPIAYPIPVLGNADDLAGAFSCRGRSRSTESEVIVEVDFNLDNPDIRQLIDAGQAAFLVALECPKTFYRRAYSFAGSKAEIRLPVNRLRGLVRIRPAIICIKDGVQFVPTTAHSDYSGRRYPLRTGEILAISPETEFLVDKDFAAARPTIASFIRPREGTHKQGIVVVQDDDVIWVEITKADWPRLVSASRDAVAAKVLHPMLILPVLAEAVRLVQTEAADFESDLWYGRLKVLLNEQGLVGRDPLEAAQALLRDPISRGFSAVQQLLEAD